jgi:PhzF family phenazine biosynthesis protein
MPRFFVIDAFTEVAFGGNQAGVCVLDGPAPVPWMQSFAAELGFAETAFLHREGEAWRLRWFTPAKEVPLCGHATLASAHALWTEGLAPGEAITFQTLSGKLVARREGGSIDLDFPASPVKAAAPPPPGLEKALGARITDFHETNGEWLLAVLEDERTVRSLRPDLAWLKTLDPQTVIVTARGTTCDYVERFFAPSWGIPEDPATGSIQTALGPYWQQRLRKDSLTVRQLSARGASMRVRPRGDRVLIGGQAVTITRGELAVPPR